MKLHEWIKATVVVGPADEPMLRRAELLEELAVLAVSHKAEKHTIDEWDALIARENEILAELAREV